MSGYHRPSRGGFGSLAAAVVVAAVALVSVSFPHGEAHSRVPPMCLGKRATIVGSEETNTLRGTKNADVIVGLGGSDRIIGGDGADLICGGGGKDRLYGGLGDDLLNGGKGADRCLQEAGTGTKKSCEGPRFLLSVWKGGSGTGTVTSSPSGIDCGQTCLMKFFEKKSVTLTPSPAAQSYFGGWGGSCTGTGPCTVVMSAAQLVTATFSKGTPPPGSTPPGSPPPASPPPGSPPADTSCASRCYVVSRTGSSYRAASSSSGSTYTGGLKSVVESAVSDLDNLGGGLVVFDAGVFDLGGDRFSLHAIAGIEFAGAGMNATVIQNSSSASADTEPFDMHDANRIVIRDMTVNAGGPTRSTSDAIDFDGGNDVLIERVKVTQSRGRGIIFDGKDIVGTVSRTADRNVIRDCVITGIPSDGIELLASRNNRVEGCTIKNVGGHGIQITKSSSNPMGQGGGQIQPNKKSNGNVLVGNVIDQAGEDGIDIISGDGNVIDNNIVTNSSNGSSGRDGIRITAFDSVECNDNVVRNTRATDNQATKTQRYGLHIASPLCNRTVVGPNNDFNGNAVAPIQNNGTNTRFV